MMEESYLAGLLVSFLFVFVLFRKDKTNSPVIDNSGSGIAPNYRPKSTNTGVEKYLSKQNNGLTGVARYLQGKESLNDNVDSAQVMSGVAKYLSAKEQASASSVSRYLEKQAIVAKEKAKRNLSSVEEYLINRG